MIVVAALYQFVALPNYLALQAPLLSFCKKNGVKGTLLLAAEGINGTISGTREGIDAVAAYLIEAGPFQNLEYKESKAETMPFLRMKVKLKKEIVTLGAPAADPTQMVGTYVAPIALRYAVERSQRIPPVQYIATGLSLYCIRFSSVYVVKSLNVVVFGFTAPLNEPII